MVSHMEQMKHNAIVCNIGHFDNEIDMKGLENFPGVKKVTVKPQTDHWTFPDGHSILVLAEGRLVNLGCATGHPSFVMSNSFTNQVLAQIDIATNYKSYKNEVYLLPKHLDEEVARLHLDHLQAELETLSDEQSKYLNIPVHGPYKPLSYK